MEFEYGDMLDISVPMVLASDDEDKENDAVMDKEEVVNLHIIESVDGYDY